MCQGTLMKRDGKTYHTALEWISVIAAILALILACLAEYHFRFLTSTLKAILGRFEQLPDRT
jgi:hypothetical protein